jgi:hypothetical protein
MGGGADWIWNICEEQFPGAIQNHLQCQCRHPLGAHKYLKTGNIRNSSHGSTSWVCTRNQGFQCVGTSAPGASGRLAVVFLGTDTVSPDAVE